MPHQRLNTESKVGEHLRHTRDPQGSNKPQLRQNRAADEDAENGGHHPKSFDHAGDLEFGEAGLYQGVGGRRQERVAQGEEHDEADEQERASPTQHQLEGADGALNHAAPQEGPCRLTIGAF